MSGNSYLVAHQVEPGCRSCGSASLVPALDLGVTPLADRLMNDRTLHEPEPVCPLTVVICRDCSLVQIRETVDPAILFGADYPYYSSVSEGLLRHFAGTVAAARKRRPVDGSSLVVELASNDGYLLKNYVQDGVPVLGIDPAPGPVEVAQKRGVNTLHAFFTRALAEELAGSGRRADILHANNVLAHVADTNGFVAGIAMVLKDDGLAVIECPYVRDLVDHCEFDTIYHQHLCYFSVTALDALFRRHGLVLVDVERVPIHGGSLRLFVARQGVPGPAVQAILAEERALGLDGPAYFESFAERVRTLRSRLREIVGRLKAEGARIVGYGAAAKACTLLAYTGIGAEQLECLVDKSTFKQGWYFPGNRLPIRSPDWLLEARPEYTLILPWNFADEIIAQQAEYRRRGGKFIIPVPEPVVV
jgi:SAM-dependent methyltransferase